MKKKKEQKDYASYGHKFYTTTTVRCVFWDSDECGVPSNCQTNFYYVIEALGCCVAFQLVPSINLGKIVVLTEDNNKVQENTGNAPINVMPNYYRYGLGLGEGRGWWGN